MRKDGDVYAFNQRKRKLVNLVNKYLAERKGDIMPTIDVSFTW